MNDKQHHQTEGQKRPYKKPELIQVPLKPDEAVLGGCKHGSTAGPGGSGGCVHVSNCFTQVS